MKLTAKAVAALTELPLKDLDRPELGTKAEHIAWDDDLPGFGYRLRVSGSKILRTWVAQYKRAGATRRITLGAANVLSAEQARLVAKKVLGAVALGQDPQAERRERRGKDQHSFRSVADEYLQAKEPNVRQRTFTEAKRYLTGTYLKALHPLPIDSVTRKDIAARIVAITRQNGSVTAARVRASASALYTWAMQMGLTDSNPVIGSVRPKESEGRTRVLTDAELAAVWCAADDDRNDYSRIVRLLILTGCRRQEVGGMRWSELDAERGMWTIPGERSKNKKPHILPLPPAAWKIIDTVPHMAHRDHLFGARAAGFAGWDDGKRKLDERLGDGVQPFILHDLRRTAATKMADIGVQPHIIEQVLNHQSGHKGGIARIYNRSSYEREVKAALAMWADQVRALVEGSERVVHMLPLDVNHASSGH